MNSDESSPTAMSTQDSDTASRPIESEESIAVHATAIHHYLATRPGRSWLSVHSRGMKQLRVLWHLLTHTFAHFEPRPGEPVGITEDSPSGAFKEEHLALCQAIFDEQDGRQERLEGKAQVVQGVVTVLVPLVIGLLVFVLSAVPELPSVPFVLVLAILSLLFNSIALVASLRAVGVRGRESLYVASVVSADTKSVRSYSLDQHARGLLWCAVMNDAMNDHVADFVRSAQAFLIMAVITGGTAGVVAALSFRPQGDETAAGTLQQETEIASEISGIQAALEGQSRATSAEIESIKVQIEDLRQLQTPPADGSAAPEAGRTGIP